MTTLEDVKRWKETGISEGATHLIVVCDTFDYMDYPVYVKPTENLEEIKSKFNNVNMQRIMETIILND